MTQIFKPLSAKGEQKLSVDVLGLTSEVFNSNEQVIGTVFFMDVDTQLDIQAESIYFQTLLIKYELSHFVILKTQNGFHIICFDVRQNKTEYFELFREFKILFNVDYEYGYKWILRLGEKGKRLAPIYKASFFNPLTQYTVFSSSHLRQYERHCFVPRYVRMHLEENQIPMITGVRKVKYKTWNY